MDTHRLKYFLRIAEEGSITRAAGLLGIAQPALSRQLQLLEDDLGVALFRRTRRGVELTEAGERLRASTAGPLRQLELAVHYAGSPLARLERYGILILLLLLFLVPYIGEQTGHDLNILGWLIGGPAKLLIEFVLGITGQTA